MAPGEEVHRRQWRPGVAEAGVGVGVVERNGSRQAAEAVVGEEVGESHSSPVAAVVLEAEVVSTDQLMGAVAARAALGDPLTGQAAPLPVVGVVRGFGQLLACAVVGAELLLLP